MRHELGGTKDEGNANHLNSEKKLITETDKSKSKYRRKERSVIE